jgi:glycosyltransferase involved in cell wall biosynthesis
VRVLHINSARTFNGGEQHFVDLCRGLHERGHEVFVALRPSNQWQARLDFLPAENILHVSLRNSYGVLSATRIAEYVRENDIEIVHAHAARDYVSASLACRIAKAAEFVLTHHVVFPIKTFHRFALTNLSKSIAVSHRVEANLLKVFPKDKIAFVPNGIDVKNRAAADREKLGQEFRFEHNIPFDVPLVGIIGELKLLKGQRDFILAANIVTQKFPEAHFVLVGQDNTLRKDFRREIKRLVKIFRLENRFLWLDWVEENSALLAALDVFVSASHTENFRLAILEAMASGCAIVTTETQGAREMLDETTAKFAPVRDAVQIATAIGEFLTDEKMRHEFGQKAQAKAKAEFDLERMIAETEKIYEEILARKNSSSR